MRKQGKNVATEKVVAEKASKITGTLKEKDFQLDEKDKELIRSLFSWSKQSEETNWVLGQPV